MHIIGGKNHGKTTLVVDLVTELTKQGMRVGTIKHTHHQHELDTPGKDSHRHREAGAAAVGICSPSMNAVFWPPNAERASGAGDSELKYSAYALMFEQCDIVLVEGDSNTTAFKIEVWRREVGSIPLAQSDPTISAIVTDDKLSDDLGVPVWSRTDLQGLATRISSLCVVDSAPSCGGSGTGRENRSR